jgi:hypothetical protein
VAEDRSSRPSVTGYVVVLLGVACWVVSSFLPLYESDLGEAVSRTTLVQQSTAFGPLGSDLGGLLYLFGGIAVIGVISILGVRGSGPWPAVLAGAVATWALPSIGVLINIDSSVRQIATDGSVTLGVAYWSCWVSVGIVVAGAASVVVSARRAEARSSRAEAPDMIRYQIPPSAPGGGVAP